MKKNIAILLLGAGGLLLLSQAMLHGQSFPFRQDKDEGCSYSSRTAQSTAPIGIFRHRASNLPQERTTAPRNAIALETTACNVQTLRTLNDAAFLRVLTTLDEDCLRDLFEIENASLLTETRAFTVLDEIETRLPQYHGATNPNLHHLLTWLHAHVFWEFYDDAVTISPRLYDRILEVLLPLSHRDDFYFTNLENLRIFDRFFTVIQLRRLGSDGEPSLGMMANFMHAYKRAFPRMRYDSLVKLSDPEVRHQARVAYNSVHFSYFLGLTSGLDDFLDSLALHIDVSDSLYSTLDARTLADASDLGISFIYTDGLREYFRSLNHSTLTDKHPALIENARSLYNAHAEFSPPWAIIVNVLEEGALFESIVGRDKDAVIKDLEAHIFPHIYRYDNGRFQVITSLPEATARRMYYAAEEVKAQFFRLVGINTSVPMDENDTLYCRVYPTPSAYDDYQGTLYGTDTNNGGIYIENRGTFYTYERTARESFLSLEELFRHEYVHYLQGRYIAPGDLVGNDAEVDYLDNPHTWFVEGSAEFLASAERTQNFRPRYNIYSRLDSDDIPSLEEIFATGYENSELAYRYSCVLMEYLYRHRRDLVDEMLSALRSIHQPGDEATYENFLRRMQSDPALQAGYEAYLRETAAAEETQWIPRTTYVGDNALLESMPNAISQALEAAGITGFAERITSDKPHALNRRIRYSVSMQAPPIPIQSLAVARDSFDILLNDKLSDLVNNHPTLSNIYAATAYCLDITLSPQGGAYLPKGNCYFEVPLRPASINYVAPTLSISPSEPQVLSLGENTLRITVASNTDWSVYSDIPGLQFDRPDSRTVEVITSSRGLCTDPTGAITFVAGGLLERDLQVTQLTIEISYRLPGATKEIAIVDGEEISVASTEGTFDLTVNSTRGWTVSDGGEKWTEFEDDDGNVAVNTFTQGPDDFRGYAYLTLFFTKNNIIVAREALLRFTQAGCPAESARILRVKQATDAVVENLIAFPNPVVEDLWIAGIEDYDRLEIYDLSGTLVHHQDEGIRIDLRLLPPGAYIVKIHTADDLRGVRVLKR